MCMPVHPMYSWYPQGPEEGVGYPGIVVTDHCESAMWVLRLEPGSSVRATFPQPPMSLFWKDQSSVPHSSKKKQTASESSCWPFSHGSCTAKAVFSLFLCFFLFLCSLQVSSASFVDFSGSLFDQLTLGTSFPSHLEVIA